MLYVHLQNPDTCRVDTKYSKGKEDTLLGFVCVCVCVQILIKHGTSVYRPCIPTRKTRAFMYNSKILKDKYMHFLRLILYNTKMKLLNIFVVPFHDYS